jgi:Na+-driven multidrug efflux pump
MQVAMCFGQPVAIYAFGQEEDVGRLVGSYCYGLLPGMWPLVLGVVLTKYLQVQNEMLYPAIATTVAFFLNIGFNAWFIQTMGFKGAPLATSLSRFVQFLLLVIAVFRFKGRSFDPSDGFDQALTDRPADAAVELEAGSTSKELADDTEIERQALLSEVPHESQALNISKPLPDQHAGSLSWFCRPRPQLTRQLSWFPSSPKPRNLLMATSQSLSRAASVSWSALSLSASSAINRGKESSQNTYSFFQDLAFRCRDSVRPLVLMRFLRLALPGGAMMAFEASSFDITTAMAGHLGPTATAAHAAMLMIIYLTYTSMPYAISITASIRVGNLLGADQPRQARLSGIICVAISGIFMLMAALVIILTRNVIGKAFTSDPEVLTLTTMIAPFAALFQISDGVMGSSQGVLRGCGYQLLLMVYNLIGFWLMGVLLGYFLTFQVGMGLKGLWIGISCGDSSAAILNLSTLFFVDWDHEAAKAKERLASISQEEARISSDFLSAIDKQHQGVEKAMDDGEASCLIVEACDSVEMTAGDQPHKSPNTEVVMKHASEHT